MDRNSKIIDRLMDFIPEHLRYSWCIAKHGCACEGATNCTGRYYVESQGASPITYSEWLSWFERNNIIVVEYGGQQIEKTAKEWHKLFTENKQLKWLVEDKTNYIEALEKRIKRLEQDRNS